MQYSQIFFDDDSSMTIYHSATLGEIFIAVLLVIIIVLSVCKWFYDATFRRK